LFTPLSDTAVIKRGATEWEKAYSYTDPGAVVYHDGQFHIFRNAFRGWPAPVQIAYMTSPDAVTWTEMSDAPVLTTDDVPFAQQAALASSVIVEDDGTWALYFYTWNNSTFERGGGEVGRATASDPLGPWTVDPEPVLSPGSEGSWDEYMVNGPTVLCDGDDGYVMYYAGYGKIGMATSPDGIAWTKYDDPATSDVPFAESDPILVVTEDWEGMFIQHPRVQQTPDGYVMIYRAHGGGPTQMKLGLASSEDGTHWMKYTGNPIFTPADVPNQVAIWFTATAYQDGIYYLFAELAPTRGSSSTEIFALAHEGSLPPAS
jgi:predicted GH43/DUF377 family glycosyl hydrolase